MNAPATILEALLRFLWGIVNAHAVRGHSMGLTIPENGLFEISIL